MSSLAAHSLRLTVARVREVAFLEHFHTAQGATVEVFEVLRLLWMPSMWVGMLTWYPIRFVDHQMRANLFRIRVSVR